VLTQNRCNHNTNRHQTGQGRTGPDRAGQARIDLVELGVHAAQSQSCNRLGAFPYGEARWSAQEWGSGSSQESVVEFVAKIAVELDEKVAFTAGGCAFDRAPCQDRHLHRAERFPEV
jgi:hypothetical protein